ncbi:hypothetical protein MBHK15_100078 [Marinobacter salarius]|nr:hypothetical protein MBHK15_100078 [Marinobacter salarius]
MPTENGELGISGAAGRIRTSDRLVRSQVLYPAELQPRIHTSRFSNVLFLLRKEMAEREGFEPSIRAMRMAP